MSTLTLERWAPRHRWPAWRQHGLALGVAVSLHAGLVWALLNLAPDTPLTPLVTPVIQTQLVSLPAPAPEPSPAVVAPMTPEPVAPTPKAALPEVVTPPPRVDEAALARKRVAQQRLEQQRREQQRQEQDRHEQQAREAQQRDAQLQAQREAQARQAESDRKAAAARAEAEAASRQYLPIAKVAPEYPQRALDRHVEGECTVAYTVNAQGRVEEPRVVDSCHPWFVKPSLAAARTFRYQPRVINGQAVAVANVKNTFTYRIE